MSHLRIDHINNNPMPRKPIPKLMAVHRHFRSSLSRCCAILFDTLTLSCKFSIDGDRRISGCQRATRLSKTDRGILMNQLLRQFSEKNQLSGFVLVARTPNCVSVAERILFRCLLASNTACSVAGASQRIITAK